MNKRILQSLLLSATLLTSGQLAFATLAQQPLLNRPNTVSPNLTLIFDTSGSMGNTYIYQYGYNDPSGNGPQGPGPSHPSTGYGSMSPDINNIYYDPRVRYMPRVNYLGADLAVDPPIPKSTGWQVYIRDTTSSPTAACPAGAYTEGTMVNLSCYYNPSYNPPASAVVAGSVATYPNVVSNATLSSVKFPKFTARTDCVASSISCNLTEEGQNVSNWMKWYRTRGLMAVTSMGLAFQPLLDDAIRFAYGTIGNINSNSILDCGMASFTSSNASPITCYGGQTAAGSKSLFYTWMYGLSMGGGTPNKFAVDNIGQYYQRTDSDGPWATTPYPRSRGFSTVPSPSGPGSAELPANHASCRRSFSMLITDGYTNGGGPTVGNVDNSAISVPNAAGSNLSSPYTQAAVAPYKDSASNTMADIAMKYWKTDSRSDLTNRVAPIVTSTINNPSTWQNVSFYAVTLGIDGTLPRTTTTLASLTSGATAWPTPTDNTSTTVDDLWHATINARGELLNARNSNQLTAGLGHLFESIAGTPQTLSGVAVSTTFLQNGTRKYKPEYIPGTWSGKLSAIQLDTSSGSEGNELANIYWQVEQGVDVNGDPISLIPAVATRQSRVFTWNGVGGTLFNTVSSGLSSDMVNYLLGDSSKELRKSGGIYRSRSAILGDIIDSNPVFVRDNVDLGYGALVGSYGSYTTFVASMAARPEGVLFIGANDGMLHAFRDNTGAEIFAYIPKAVIPNLYHLSETPYTHRYYVDGPNIETHAYLSSAWRDVLVGTVGAGGTAVYALDVTSPTTMGASSIMWELSASTPGFANLGSVLSDVQAGPVTAVGNALNDDQWVAIFGNGYGSTSGVASLFVVNLKTGTLLKEIVADAAGGNGLGGVRLVRDATQRIIGAYAGDLKGNMWKFDLTGASNTNWKVDLGGQALYKAGSTQPITAAPAVVEHPNGGYVVDFGTGKFFDTTDATGPYVTQRLYGVWDKQAFGTSVPPLGAAGLTGTSQLLQQTITTVNVLGVDYYALSTGIPVWGDGLTSGSRGWYYDLPNSGQRVPYPIDRLFASVGDTFIMASTLSPVSATPTDVCMASGSGSGWVYLMDGVTGSGPTQPALDINHDGNIDSGDNAAAGGNVIGGYQDGVDGRPTAITIVSTLTHDEACIETSVATCNKIDLKCGQTGTHACPPPVTPPGITVNKREWRQLFMR